MSVLALFSVKGAPGTTTTAMLLSSLWPRPALLVDADPAGGDVGLRLPAEDGRPVDLNRGLLTLLPDARRAMSPESVLDHAQRVVGGGEVIAGLGGPEQATAAGSVWGSLADLFAGLHSHDTFLDLGRLDVRSPVLPLAVRADIAICVLQASLSGVYAARARLRTLVPALRAQNGTGPRLGVLVQSPTDRDAESAASVIRSELPEVAEFGRVATDANAARLFAGEQVSRPERTMLVRSGREVVGTLDGMLYAASWTGATGVAR
jgi:hypothetical protein